MEKPDDADKATAGRAALSICESLLIALSDLKILNDREVHAVLEDAMVAHRNAAAGSSNAEEHRAVVALIERIMNGGRAIPRA